MLEELLQKINKLEKNMELLLELHLEQSDNLTTYKDVARFLGKSKKTVYNYIKDGKLVLDEHYYKEDNKKIVFISKAIVEFKTKGPSVITKELKEDLKIPKRVNNSIVSSILRGVV
ncbi:MAG: helix-turn-helix domain-containing protein [Campylobacterota bacterium]|nr:helix-turn-helix domain-containing protein [Campylobacterota bacterium]